MSGDMPLNPLSTPLVSSRYKKLITCCHTYDEKVHLVFSVRDTGEGEEVGNENKVGLRLASGLLKLMNSELKIINSPQSGSEAYFELETSAAGGVTLGEAGLELG